MLPKKDVIRCLPGNWYTIGVDRCESPCDNQAKEEELLECWEEELLEFLVVVGHFGQYSTLAHHDPFGFWILET